MPMPLSMTPDLKAPKAAVLPLTSIYFGPDPQGITCPYCHAQIVTEMKSKATSKTHLIALLLCCCLCWPCVCLPYCMKSCQNRNHSCPHCHAFLGTYKN